MEKRYEAFFEAERKEMEFEIMAIFASFIDGLTIKDIQKQSLCVGFSNF